MRLELQKKEIYWERKSDKAEPVGPHMKSITEKNRCIWCGAFEKEKYAGNNHLIDLCSQVS